MKDPNFFNRPDHPDFWRLSRLVRKHDEDDAAFEAVVGAVVDLDSALYMADQRALRSMAMLPTFDAATPAQRRALLGALYLDAFMLGAAFAKDKAENPDTTLDFGDTP